MSKIKVTSKCEIYDGMSITFKAPCDCTAVDGLNVYYHDRPYQFSFRDTHGNDLAGIRNLFTAGSYVKVVLDTASGFAYIQNADSNAYLEARLDSILTDETKTLYGLGVAAVPDDVFKQIRHDLLPNRVGIKFTESREFVVPENIQGNEINVICVGGGGSGGGGKDLSSGGGGGGGGSGHVVIETVTVTPGETIQVVIGAGGAAVGDSTDGNPGGTTSFGSYVTAPGGEGGRAGTAYNANPIVAGAGAGGSGEAGGGGGSCGGGSTANAKKVTGGAGGNGRVYGGGGGGGSHYFTAGAGGAGGTYGGGGGGGSHFTSNADGISGTGGAGGTYGGSGGSDSAGADGVFAPIPSHFLSPLVEFSTDILSAPGGLCGKTTTSSGTVPRGGGGGGGYNSAGGSAVEGGAGGGGGYYGPGGATASTSYYYQDGGAGGGGFGGTGGAGGKGGSGKGGGGGGGGGFFGNGGAGGAYESSGVKGEANSGAGGGGAGGNTSTNSGAGGSGICMILYSVTEVD